MMGKCVNHALAAALVASEHPDLRTGNITAGIAAEAADIFAQMVTTLGYRVVESFADGRCVTQSFQCTRTGRILSDVETTALLMPDESGAVAIHLAVRTNHMTAVSTAAISNVFAGSSRVHGIWFSSVRNGVDCETLLLELARTQAMRLEIVSLVPTRDMTELIPSCALRDSIGPLP